MLAFHAVAPMAFAMRTPMNIKMQAEAAVTEVPEPVPPTPLEIMKAMPGSTAPLGFFDPLSYCSAEGVTEGKVRFYREAELKHGRVAMLAALGFVVAESFHPLFGGSVDVPSYVAFQETPLQGSFFPVVLSLAIFEVFSVFTFENPKDGLWSIKADHTPGDLGFDPLGLKPTDPAELAEMQSKELNNGRLAMIAIAGMVGQELVSGAKMF
jgi:light-harvesting complex I chlorophyll a/b binding protein 4